MSETADYSDLSIRRLELHGVGPFRDLVLDFPRKRAEDKDKAEVHIFVGENGTGKTTLLEAMTCFERWFGSTIDLDGKKHRNVDWTWPIEKKQNATSYGITIDFSGKVLSRIINDADKNTRNDLQDWFNIYFSSTWEQMPNHQYLFFAYQSNRILRTHKVSQGSDEAHSRRLLIAGIRWNKVQEQRALYQWVLDCLNKAESARKRGDTFEAKEYDEQLLKVRMALTEIVGRPVGFALQEGNLPVRIKHINTIILAENLSSGLQSLIGWLADLIYRLSQFPAGLNSHFTLFLDEIDIHLHPKAQRKILPVIQKLFPNAQIFITTHSPFVVGSVDGAWVYKFKLDAEGYSVLDGEPRLSEDADSYRTILEEVFDIHEQFGVEAQSKLDEFYKLRKEVLENGSDEKWLQFNELGRDLAGQSAEMHSYVSLELRQAARVLNRQLIA